MGLLTDEHLLGRALRAHAARLVDRFTDERKLGLGLTNHSGDHLACVNTDFKHALLTIFKGFFICNGNSFLGKVSAADWVMVAKQLLVNCWVEKFKTSTSHVGFADGLNLWEAVLLTELIKRIVKTIEQLDELFAAVLRHNCIELVYVDENDCDFTLSVWKVLLTFFNAISNERRDQNIDDLQQLVVFFWLSETGHKLDLLRKLVLVSVDSPNKHNQKDVEELKIGVELLTGGSDVLIRE